MDSHRNIEQWGYEYTSNTAWRTITFPLAFSTCYAIVNGCGSGDDSYAIKTEQHAHEITAKQFEYKGQYRSYNYWMAVGKG